MADVGQDYLGDGASSRFGEMTKLLPVSCVGILVVVLYLEYVYMHCIRLLQWDVPENQRDGDMLSQAYWQTTTFHVITSLLVYCLVMCITTDPGAVPDGKGWELRPDVEGDVGAGNEGPALVEKKHTGERRHCKWCLKYKPDRCHHCRVCNLCILKMDHHCPWVYNCIGFRNHKYFFLLLVYVVIDLIVINVTMFDSVWWATRVDVSILTMLILLFGETLAMFLVVLMATFLSFHVWLMMKAMTTVEFCEKSLKKASYDSSIYSVGIFGNICAVLGPVPLLWLMPVSFPSGDGLVWTAKSQPSSSSSEGRRESASQEGQQESLIAAQDDAPAEPSRSSRGKRSGR